MRPGAAAALIRAGPRRPLRLEPGDADIRLVVRNAGETAIDDEAHAFNRQRGLGDRRRQHHLAAAGLRRRDRFVLCGAIHRPKKRRNVYIRVAQPLFEQGGGPHDLALTGQEDQSRAALGGERRKYDAGGVLLDAQSRVATDIARLDRKRPAGALDDRRIAEQTGDAGPIERRRHDEEAQILAQGPLRVERQSEAKIGVERALVEFVEQHRSDAFERWIIKDHPCEDALGDDFDPRLGRDERLHSHPEADSLADLFAERRGHSLCGGAGRESARLQEQHLAVMQKRKVDQCKRHAGRLAGAWRSHQHGAAFCRKIGAKRF